MKRLLAASTVAAAALAVLFLARPARAGQAFNNLTVSATVIGICTIDPATLTFANYDSTAALTGSGTITVHCTQGSSFWIGLDAGSNGARRMANGTNYLSYELYRDGPPNFATVWDNADPGAASHTSATSAGTAAYTATVYGRIPANQIVPMGTYSDTVHMTVNF